MYLFILTKFIWGLDLVSNSHNPGVALYFFPYTNTCLSLYLELYLPILKQPLLSSWYTPKLGSSDTLRLNTSLLYFECIGKEFVSNSESYVYILNRGGEPIIRLRFGLVLKLGCVLPVYTIGIRIGSRICFSLFKNGSWCRRTLVSF